jgi:hypothetical protein
MVSKYEINLSYQKKSIFLFVLGTHVFVGCVFTSALKSDPNVQHVLKEFAVSPVKGKSLKDGTENQNDNDSVFPTIN